MSLTRGVLAQQCPLRWLDRIELIKLFWLAAMVRYDNLSFLSFFSNDKSRENFDVLVTVLKFSVQVTFYTICNPDLLFPEIQFCRGFNYTLLNPTRYVRVVPTCHLNKFWQAINRYNEPNKHTCKRAAVRWDVRAPLHIKHWQGFLKKIYSVDCVLQGEHASAEAKFLFVRILFRFSFYHAFLLSNFLK